MDASGASAHAGAAFACAILALALGLRRRLELVRVVCGAIQRAHQKGVIRRDIKQIKVLVATRDGGHAPMVIDLGIAKATEVELRQKTMVTQHDQLVGTAESMAPAQASMIGEDMDTRADVDSLGALLTCTKPFDVREVQARGQTELLRRIREVDPERPSTRVSSLGGASDSVTSIARFTRVRLSSSLRGELDWIVMKALEKGRARRYAAASEFASAIGRDLAVALREPVELERDTPTASLFVPIPSCALGSAVAGQGRLDEAERVLVEASESLVQVAVRDPATPSPGHPPAPLEGDEQAAGPETARRALERAGRGAARGSVSSRGSCPGSEPSLPPRPADAWRAPTAPPWGAPAACSASCAR